MVLFVCQENHILLMGKSWHFMLKILNEPCNVAVLCCDWYHSVLRPMALLMLLSVLWTVFYIYKSMCVCVWCVIGLIKLPTNQNLTFVLSSYILCYILCITFAIDMSLFNHLLCESPDVYLSKCVCVLLLWFYWYFFYRSICLNLFFVNPVPINSCHCNVLGALVVIVQA